MVEFGIGEIRVWIDEKCTIGSLFIDKEEMLIRLESGEIVSGNDQRNVIYEVTTQFVNGKHHSLQPTLRVKLQPFILSKKRYNLEGGQYIEDIFPPSSYGYYGRMRSGSEKYLYIVQETEDKAKLWLTIAHPKTGQICETHTIFPYEVETLSLMDNEEFRSMWYESIWSTIPKSERNEILSILDRPSVSSWNELESILGDILIPNQPLGKTMRETLSLVIPQSFPNSVREQLMLFLTLVVENRFTIEDPINFLYRFWSFPILGALLEGHLMCIADNVPYPPYLQILRLASKRDLSSPTRAIPQSIQESPWLLFWQKTIEQNPNWSDIAMGIVRNLTKKDRMITRLPITSAAAKKSPTAWKKRLAVLTCELKIFGRINYKKLGLSKLAYLGSAYRWPHRHMEFITRLGSSGENTPYLHVMVMPPSAASRVKRALPSTIEASLTVRTSNNDLFDDEKKEWTVSVDQILTATKKTYSYRKLSNRFNSREKTGITSINSDEAKVADLVSDGIRVAGLEREEYLKPWDFTSAKVQKLLTSLSDRKIIRLYYEASNQNLTSLATIIHGPPEKVTAVSNAFLNHTPTTLMMLDETGLQSILLSKIPKESLYELASELPPIGLEHGLTIRCLRPTTFQSYTHNLYRRLLKEDGTWDDDVSAFLSQARSKRRELSESNA